MIIHMNGGGSLKTNLGADSLSELKLESRPGVIELLGVDTWDPLSYSFDLVLIEFILFSSDSLFDFQFCNFLMLRLIIGEGLTFFLFCFLCLSIMSKFPFIFVFSFPDFSNLS